MAEPTVDPLNNTVLRQQACDPPQQTMGIGVETVVRDHGRQPVTGSLMFREGCLRARREYDHRTPREARLRIRVSGGLSPSASEVW